MGGKEVTVRQMEAARRGLGDPHWDKLRGQK
jgi:hypothetical protein